MIKTKKPIATLIQTKNGCIIRSEKDGVQHETKPTGRVQAKADLNKFKDHGYRIFNEKKGGKVIEITG